jgi:hypothetical protein
VEPLTQFGRKLVDLMFSVNGDCLASRIENDLAVVALAHVLLDLGEEFGIDLTVEIVSQLAKEVGAGHGLAPPFFCRK